MCAVSRLRSFRDMDTAMILLLMIAPALTAVVTATSAKKTNERYRARRAAKAAARQA